MRWLPQSRFKIRPLLLASAVSPQLPIEVWEDVIDHFGGYEARDLAALCLTSRAFVPRARYQMYQNIKIRSLSKLEGITQVLSHSQIGRAHV